MNWETVQPDQVVIGIIVRGGRILVQPREGDPALAGCWEFPGGKCTPGERHAVALARETLEETGLTVRVGELVCAHSHVYPDRRVSLHTYLCEASEAASLATNGEWLTPTAYRARPMPEANGPILDALDWTLSHPA